MTGTTPFDGGELARASREEVRRIIKEEEPPRPSTRLTELQRRRVGAKENEGPSGVINPELDWIAMKALEKDRARRYETANAFAADIWRHLQHEPVEAGPPSFSYRLGKGFRRYRAAVLTTAAIVILSLAGAILTTWQWRRALRSEAGALESAEVASTEAKRARDTARIASHRVAEELFSAGKPELGIVELADLLRQDPGNRVAAERLLSAIWQRPMRWFVSPPLFTENDIFSSSINTRGELFVAISDDSRGFEVIDTFSGLPRGRKMELDEGMEPGWGELSDDDRFLMTHSLTESLVSQVQMWNWQTGERVGPCLTHPRAMGYTATIGPKGKSCLIAGSDGGVMVWNRGASPDPGVQRFQIHETSIRVTKFSPDGEWVASGGLSGKVKVWNIHTGEEMGSALSHEGVVTWIDFDSSGKRLAVATSEGMVRVWDLETGQSLGKTIRHPAPVRMLDFSPDGITLLSACQGGRARLSEVETGEPVGPDFLHEDKVLSAQFDSSGSRIVTATGQIFRVWSVASLGEPIQKGVGPVLVHAAAFTRNDTGIYLRRESSPTRILEARPAQPKSLVFRHPSASPNVRWGGYLTNLVSSIAFGKGGSTLASVGFDGAVRLWDVGSGDPIGSHHHGGLLNRVSFSPDNSFVSVSGSRGPAIHSPGNIELVRYLQKRKTQDAIVSPVQDDRGRWRIATYSQSRMKVLIQIWDAESGQQLGEDLHQGSGRGWTKFGGIRRLAFSGDGKFLIADCGDLTAKVWQIEGDSKNWKLVAHLGAGNDQMGRDHQLWAVCLSPDGRKAATSSEDGTARIWDVQSGVELFPPLRHAGVIADIEFSSDGLFIATCSGDATGQIWDAGTGQPVGETLRHTEGIGRIRFSPDGRRVVTASFDGTARVWDVTTGLPLSELLQHHGWVFDAAFSTDGRKVATSGVDLAVRVWDLPVLPDGPIPSWLPEWAEALVGLRKNHNGKPVAISWEEGQRIRKRVRDQAKGADLYVKTVRWFYDNPSARTITPTSKATVEDYVRNRLAETDADGEPRRESLEEVLRIDPENSEAFAKLAGVLLGEKGEGRESELRQARYFIRQALQGDPDNEDLLKMLDEAKSGSLRDNQ